ncbi:MAG: aminopeptidase [Verrucomicrobiota bacterium]
MKTIPLVTLSLCLALIGGCAKSTRSLSNSSYREPGRTAHFAPRQNDSDPGFEYRGELSEFDVLGITRTETASNADIEKALAAAKQIRLKPGASVMLVQSGAIFPDAPMVNELSKHFRVVPFTGVPPVSRRGTDGQFERYDAGDFSKSLRLAAARGGCETILCYWGILESESAKLATKTVSWVPVASWFIPDENQHMRIRLKLALVDVRTGDWTVLSPNAIEASKLSVSPRRAVADQKLVEHLKQQAYESGAKELLSRYAEVAAK